MDQLSLWHILPIGTIAINLVGFYYGLTQSARFKNSLGQAYWLYPWGVFVWADAIVLSPFFVGVGVVALLANSYHLFMLLFCSYWLIRSLGETIYWFNQQFSTIIRVPGRMLPMYKRLVHDEYSCWFLVQIFMQCISVVSLIGTIYFATIWMQQITASG